MALTLVAEQRLANVSLVDLFIAHQAAWTAAAARTYRYIQESFPTGAIIRPDDVAKILAPILAADNTLQHKLAASKLKQKFWISDFTDLIIDRVWGQIANGVQS